MKRIHVLRFDGPPEAIDPLARKGRAIGRRIGYLRWTPRAEPPVPADGNDLFRSVRVERGRATATKPMAGPPVWRDVVREYFRGCAAVLVATGSDSVSVSGSDSVSDIDSGSDSGSDSGIGRQDALPEEIRLAPRLRIQGSDWIVESVGEARRLQLSADDLLQRLGRPRPFHDGSRTGGKPD